MQFKKIGTIGNGSIVIKAGYIGEKRVIMLKDANKRLAGLREMADK